MIGTGIETVIAIETETGIVIVIGTETEIETAGTVPEIGIVIETGTETGTETGIEIETGLTNSFFNTKVSSSSTFFLGCTKSNFGNRSRDRYRERDRSRSRSRSRKREKTPEEIDGEKLIQDTLATLAASRNFANFLQQTQCENSNHSVGTFHLVIGFLV